MINYIDKLVGFLCGYGFGAVTIKSEVSAVNRFLKGQINKVIDCGGNKGLYVAEVLRRNDKAEVYVFEPSSLNYKILIDRFSAWECVKIVNMAVSNEVGEMSLYSDNDGSGLASLAKRNMEHFNLSYEEIEKVAVTTLDTEFSSGEFDLLKLDIEGFELAALNGSKRLLKQTKVIQFEFGGANIDTRTYFQDFYYFFKNNDFTLWRITPFGLRKVRVYSERMERFVTTNYIATNNNYFE